MNYDNKKFKILQNSENGELEQDMIFVYKQQGKVISCEYKGGKVLKGHLLGFVSEKGVITMSYHQILEIGVIQTGKCTSTPEVLNNGKIRLHEYWQWTSGDKSKGESILEEL